MLAFFLETLIQLARDYINIELLNDHSGFSGSWLEYIESDYTMTFLISPMVFLVLILLPYNLIILQIGLNRLRYLHKVGIFLSTMIIVFCLIGTFENVWLFPVWNNLYYLIYFIPYSVLFSGLIHYFVDNRTA